MHLQKRGLSFASLWLICDWSHHSKFWTLANSFIQCKTGAQLLRVRWFERHNIKPRPLWTESNGQVGPFIFFTFASRERLNARKLQRIFPPKAARREAATRQTEHRTWRLYGWECRSHFYNCARLVRLFCLRFVAPLTFWCVCTIFDHETAAEVSICVGCVGFEGWELIIFGA